MTKQLEARIRSGEARAGVVGLGYVGLPLAVEFAASGLRVTGIDVSAPKVEAINAGRSYILDVPTERVAGLVGKGLLSATSDFAAVKELDTINICVPTPLRKTREPDLSYVVGAIDGLLPYMRPGQLLILESTTYPGTTDEVVLPKLRAVGLEPGRDVEVAFSPERTDPGNKNFDTRTIPKVVGGCTPVANAAARALYGRCIDQVVMVSSPRVAEMVKLLENTFRSVNIALANEMAMMCDHLASTSGRSSRRRRRSPSASCRSIPGPASVGTASRSTRCTLRGRPRPRASSPASSSLRGRSTPPSPSSWPPR